MLPAPPFVALAATMIAMFAPIPAEAKAPACPGFADGTAAADDVRRFYVERAVEIVRAGVEGNSATLERLVSPDAEFAVWNGDASYAPRGDGADRRTILRGAAGASALIRHLRPIGYRAVIIHAGLISLQAVECQATAELLLRTARPGRGIAMRFDFVDGRLVTATGHEAVLIEGDFR